MVDYIKNIVYNEGYAAHKDGVSCLHNPYEGVSDTLQQVWYDAWWDAWYKDDI